MSVRSAASSQKRSSRLQIGKNSGIFLTYSAMPDWVSREMILESLKRKLKWLEQWIVARELHKDGTPHFHCVLKVSRRLDCPRGPAHFDLTVSDLVSEAPLSEVEHLSLPEGFPGHFHPNLKILKGKAISDCLKYVKKEDETPLENFASPGSFFELAASGDWKAARSAFASEFPKEAALHYPKLTTSLKMVAFDASRSMYTKYTPKDFVLPVLAEAEFNDWKMNFSETRALIIVGESGLGKTSFVRATFPEGLVVSHIDDLKKNDDPDQALIFDDIKFGHIPRESAIHLIDVETTRSVHCRHTTGVVYERQKRIFVINPPLSGLFPDGWETDVAFQRRIKIIQLLDQDLRANAPADAEVAAEAPPLLGRSSDFVFPEL